MSDYNRGFGSRSTFPQPLNLSGMPPELAAATIEAEEGRRAWEESTKAEPIAHTQAPSPDSSYEPYKSPSLPEGVNTVDPYYGIRRAGDTQLHNIGRWQRHKTFNIRQQERDTRHKIDQRSRDARFNIREAERKGLRGVDAQSYAASRAASRDAHNLSNQLHDIRTQLSSGEITTETARALRNAALNAFDPYAEGRYSRAQNRIKDAADDARQLSGMRFEAARGYQRDVTGFSHIQAGQRRALNKQQYENKQKQLTAEARIAQMRERHQQENLLRTFKSSVKASIEGVRENLHKESLALRNRAKRGNIYSAAEKAASASRAAAAAALQHGSTTMQRTAMNTKLLAETTLTAKHTLLSKQLDSYNTLGITFSRQLSAVQRASSLSDVRNAQAAYTEALKADLDALYEVTI